MSYKKEILKLKEDGKTNKEISEILGCSLSIIYHYSPKNEINYFKEELIDELQLKYDSGSTLKELSEIYKYSLSTIKKYIKPRYLPKVTLEQRRKNSVVAVTKRRQLIKEKAVELKGGKCERCGYDKCIAALEFHHIDKTTKDFSISMYGHSRSWEKVKIELEKCELICANCHREAHHNE